MELLKLRRFFCGSVYLVRQNVALCGNGLKAYPRQIDRQDRHTDRQTDFLGCLTLFHFQSVHTGLGSNLKSQ